MIATAEFAGNIINLSFWNLISDAVKSNGLATTAKLDCNEQEFFIHDEISVAVRINSVNLNTDDALINFPIFGNDVVN